MTGVPPSGSGLRPCGAEPQDASQAKPLVPNAAFVPCEGRSVAQCALLNELIRRSGGKARVRYFNSVDWKSLTFFGERHDISMVADGRGPLEAMLAGLEDAEFSIPTAILADIAPSSEIKPLGNGQFTVDVQALTVDEGEQ